jgi:O-antigen/teichoic acid export membrane protein
MLSGKIALFYEEPAIVEIFNVFALYFFIVPFGGIKDACLRRELNFKTITKVVFVSKLIQVMVTLTLAYLGFGFMSMAWGMVCEKLIYVLAINYYGPSYVPRHIGFTYFKEIIYFGSKMTFYGFSKQTRASLPELFIAKTMTMELNGFYARAFGAVQIFNKMFTQAIMNVVLPHFSKEGNKDNQSYIHIVSLFTVFSFSFFGFLIINAYPIVNILYGGQWDESIPLVRILCIWAAIASLYSFSTQYFIANGLENSLVKFEALLLPVSFLVVYLLSDYGLFEITSSLIIIAFFEFVFISYLLFLNCGLHIFELIKGIYKSILVSVITNIIPFYVMAMMEVDSENLFYPLLLSILGALLGWLFSVYLLNHEIKVEINEVLNKLKLVVK